MNTRDILQSGDSSYEFTVQNYKNILNSGIIQDCRRWKLKIPDIES